MRRCLECGSETHPIRLLDQAHHRGHLEPEYTAIDEKRNWFSGRFPVQGKVGAELCSACGRIVLYAQSPADSELVPSDAPAGRGDEPTPAE